MVNAENNNNNNNNIYFKSKSPSVSLVDLTQILYSIVKTILKNYTI